MAGTSQDPLRVSEDTRPRMAGDEHAEGGQTTTAEATGTDTTALPLMGQGEPRMVALSPQHDGDAEALLRVLLAIAVRVARQRHDGVDSPAPQEQAA